MNKRKFNRCLMRIRRGDLNALSLIYDEYYGKFVITANQILHNYELSEDVASDMLEKIVRYAQRNEHPRIEHVGAYLYSAVRRLAKDVYSSNERYDTLDDLQEEVETKETDLTDYEYLEHMLDSLGEVESDIAVRCYFYGYKIKEIAADLEMSESVVKGKLNEIKKQLAKHLEEN